MDVTRRLWRRTGVVVAGAWLVVLAGCAPVSVPPGPSNAVATAEPPGTGARPTDSGQPGASVRPSLESLGDRYLALLEPLNDAACEFDTVLRSPGAGRVVLRPVSNDLADALQTFIDAARQVEWPVETQEAIDDLTQGMEMHEAALRAAVDSTDNESFFANLNAAQQARAAAAPAALLVRTTLGLDGLRQTCTDP